LHSETLFNCGAVAFWQCLSLEASLRSDEIMAKVPSRGADLSAARKKNGLIEAIAVETAAARENHNS
jgi:hypothetical protein